MKAHLEITWKAEEDDAGNNWLAVYELVMPVQKNDIRDKGDGFMRLEIGKTKVRVGAKEFPINKEGDVETPFRDGCHAKWDAETLAVEAWAVYGNRKTRIA
jgi:hypothetical protein